MDKLTATIRIQTALDALFASDPLAVERKLYHIIAEGVAVLGKSRGQLWRINPDGTRTLVSGMDGVTLPISPDEKFGGPVDGVDEDNIVAHAIAKEV